MHQDIAISVKNVSKTFKIPHEKVTSIRGAVTGFISRKRGFEEFKALDNVSFEVKKGEFFGIIGRNGSGKSTLLKVLAGIYQPDKGSTRINGMLSPFLELGIGFNPELSGRDNIYLNATVLGMAKKQIDAKFDSIVKFSELERFIDQKLKNYSSGMQVRLAFSVSIHANRDILLMDEVLAVGDSNFQSKCLTEFNKYRDMGRTVIIVTHDIAMVERYCDRAMLLRNGKIVKVGKAEDVGNAYIYENINDEEKIMAEGEKQKLVRSEIDLKKLKGKELVAEKKRIELEKAKQEEERKNKVAEITKVEFLDKNGRIRQVFMTGDDMSVKIYFKINKMQDGFSFGFGMLNSENWYVMGTNTFFDKVDTKKCVSRGYVQLDFTKIRLLKGTYYIRFSIANDNYSVLYDALQRSQSFKVASLIKKDGLFDMEYSWIEV